MMNIKALQLYYRERYIFLFFSLALGTIVLSLLWIVFKIGIRTADIPLHYNIFFGIDWYGPGYYIFLHPAGAILLGTLNFLLGYRLYPRDKYLSYYLGLLAFFMALLTLLHLLSLTIYVL